jgi:hypothetical protein
MERDLLAPRPARSIGPLILALAAGAACGQGAPTQVAGGTAEAARVAGVAAGPKASGTFAPAGPPLAPPVRVDAGGHCVIDLRQGYTVSGSLSGPFDIDFRILTYGPCPASSPAPGVYDEVWIAHGSFTGTLVGDAASATFTYVADIRAGGDVRGTIVLADGLEGTLRVRGNFADGALTYRGQVGSAP